MLPQKHITPINSPPMLSQFAGDKIQGVQNDGTHIAFSEQANDVSVVAKINGIWGQRAKVRCRIGQHRSRTVKPIYQAFKIMSSREINIPKTEQGLQCFLDCLLSVEAGGGVNIVAIACKNFENIAVALSES